MHRYRREEEPIEISLKEEGELSPEDIESVAEFIAIIAYNNLKKAHESANALIQNTLKRGEDDCG
jgi:hypothetical protein